VQASSLALLQAVNLSTHVVVFVSKKYLVSANCNQEVMRIPSLLAYSLAGDYVTGAFERIQWKCRCFVLLSHLSMS
jgi:hypothetical protein